MKNHQFTLQLVQIILLHHHKSVHQWNFNALTHVNALKSLVFVTKLMTAEMVQMSLDVQVSLNDNFNS